jgi:D-alanyl-lipoteichoic acid acyltransferase DltB (MBOAT superfamily)
MLFNSYTFAMFFAIFSALYWVLARRVRAQNVLIILGSFIFYGWWDVRFLVLVIVSIAADFLFGWGASGERNRTANISKSLAFLWGTSLTVVAIAGREATWILEWLAGYTAVLCLALFVFENKLGQQARRRAYMWASVTSNLGILGFFKYFNFFAGTFEQAASTVGWHLTPVELSIVLPVGISFYTFQTLSYVIDCYRGQQKPAAQLIEFSSFVSFFPQLVAGPIERARNLLPQFFARRTITLDRFSSGVWLFVWGLCKKVVIADNLAPVADMVFASPGSYASTDLLAGLLAFAFQIYCDFSGYSDMARGTARLLGFELSLNFNIPYIARTPSEFWQRWHISLSSWLRDYLYIPLGGNREGRWKSYRNLAITMLLGGLWHGANWTFIAWGAYHGSVLIVYRALGIDAKLAQSSGSKAIDMARDFFAVAVMSVILLFSWLLFRARSIDAVSSFLVGFAHLTHGDFEIWGFILPLIGGLVLVQTAQVWQKRLEIFGAMSGIPALTSRALVVYSIIFLAAQGSRQFIYFDF